MIYGIGIDLVRTERMVSSLNRFGDRIAKRVLLSQELDVFRRSRNPAAFLAKCFAAKEAMAKALGTGFSKGVGLKTIEVRNDALGKPFIVCHEQTLQLLRDNEIDNVQLSITDEQDNAVAMVVLESTNRPATTL